MRRCKGCICYRRRGQDRWGILSGLFWKKTIELSALQDGKTQSLGLSEVEVGSYQTLSLVLDLNTDQDDNKPGCYVLTVDNEKKNLLSDNTTSLQINSSISFDSQEGRR